LYLALESKVCGGGGLWVVYLRDFDVSHSI